MWNKREKEVAQHQLNAEQKVLKQLEQQYRLALEDVKLAIQIMMADEQTISKIHQIKYQKNLQKQLEGILEKLHLGEYKSLKQYLNDCYTDAFVGTMYDMHGQGVPVIAPVDQQAAIKAIQLDTKLADRKIHKSANGEMMALYESLGIDTDKLKQTIRQEITRGLASGMRFEDIARNIANVSKAPLSRAKTIARTEGHRIQQASAEDARQLAKSKGADVLKQWDASLDGATRQTHKELDGQIQEVNKPFKSGTKSAMYPGDFGDASEDCNCRCAALTRARWALDEDELKVMQERAAVFGLSEEKKQTFEDFRKNFLKAAETVENTGKSGIIVRGNIAIPQQKFVGYALDPNKDPNKALAFKNALGYDQSNADELIQNILDHVDESKFVPKDDIGYGMRYEFIMALLGSNGKTANVLTAWIQDGNLKRLTSAYVTDKKVTE